MRRYFSLFGFVALLLATLPAMAAETAKQQAQAVKEEIHYFTEAEALKISQSAIGNTVGDYTFIDRSGRKVSMSEYRGKPLVISLIYTNCPIICGTITRNLRVLKKSQEALGVDSFRVLTVGFDTENDTPTTMGYFADRNDVNLPNWEFVSTDAETIKKLSKDLGFVFTPNPEGGYDHISQTTIVDAKGKIYVQIYGDEFENITLLQPLKDVIYNIQSVQPGLAGISNRVRLFCTLYDRKTGEYKVNYNYFIGIGMGIFLSILILWWIVHEYRRSPKRHHRIDEENV